MAGTQAGILQWTDTPEQGLYRLLLDKGLVRIYQIGPRSGGDNFVGCTVLNAGGITLHDVQVPRSEGGPLVTLYDLVDGSRQESALDELLDELRSKIQNSSRCARPVRDDRMR